MGSGDAVLVAKTFLDAIRPFRTVAVRGAVLNGKRLDSDSVTRLATLPSRQVLLGQLAGRRIFLRRVERRPPRLNLKVYPYLPQATVATTMAKSYLSLLAGGAL